MLKCAVIGSINMDMVVRVDRFPKPGETRTGDRFSVVPGGKGANQAVAQGKLGGQVAMAGCVCLLYTSMWRAHRRRPRRCPCRTLPGYPWWKPTGFYVPMDFQ